MSNISAIMARISFFLDHEVCFVLYKNDVRFGSSLLLVVCRRGSCFVYVICAWLSIVMSKTCCVVFLFFFILCTLCCKFLWIVHFVLPLRCSLTFTCTNTFGLYVVLPLRCSLTFTCTNTFGL